MCNAKLHCNNVLHKCIINMDNIKFEWDSKKEKTNIKKHGLDFSTAAHVFADEFRIEFFDEKNSLEEARYRVIGAVNGYLTVITVAYTTRENESIIRIISARSATREEKEEYYRGYN